MSEIGTAERLTDNAEWISLRADNTEDYAKAARAWTEAAIAWERLVPDDEPLGGSALWKVFKSALLRQMHYEDLAFENYLGGEIR